MPALRRLRVPLALSALAIAATFAAGGCKPKASPNECDALIDRYAELVVTEHFPDAGGDQVRAERDREKREARGDDAFKNCSSEVSHSEYECAMRAGNADALEKCLE
ncbi:MAG TPA: hypothetical protein VHV30_13185 [Polyangiaceae bacterium]|nr:hypothetical protein [Polyangiaceae bacterium]